MYIYNKKEVFKIKEKQKIPPTPPLDENQKVDVFSYS